MMRVEPLALHDATRDRYLAYALSVVTSRALPDVRDGLKPVQRRILLTMFKELSLHPGGRYRKCAAVVGEVMGKYHPHGDQSIYDALVRMAQPFSLRNPLVDGQGNFGSLDGDRAAAMRYTECKLRPLAEELLTELGKGTVDYRPNYDGQRFEPIVLPAQFPHLLVNGSEGIAVGMATRILPHNLGEVIDATVALIDDSTLGVAEVMQHLKGPDFPTGGRLLTSASDRAAVYQSGQGSLRVRATYTTEKQGRTKRIVIDSIPYGQNKAKLLEHIGAQVIARKLPQVTDVRDESTEAIRIVIDLKPGDHVEAVMAYLFKHTQLEASLSVNTTALIPAKQPDRCQPARLDVVRLLRYWIDFRLDTVRRRLRFDLNALRERIHLLQGFATVFDALDQIIAIIRASEGKRHAAEQLMDAFDLTAAQTDAILELKLYRLAKLEILLIRQELEEKRAEAERLEALLASDDRLRALVRTELLQIKSLYAEPRRTLIDTQAAALIYDAEAYIEEEDAIVVITRGGWIKRQSSFTELSKIRVREDDSVGWLIRASTRSTLSLFTSHGTCYGLRVHDIPATTGHGEPLSRQFSLTDGARVVGVISHDARYHPRGTAKGDSALALAITERGRVLRFALASHAEPSTKAGRKFARLNTQDAVFAVYPCDPQDTLALATTLGRAMRFPVSEINVLKAAGKGVIGIHLREADRVMAAEIAAQSTDGPQVVTAQGRTLTVSKRAFGQHKRGGRGAVVLKRGSLDTWLREPVVLLGASDPHPTSGDA